MSDYNMEDYNEVITNSLNPKLGNKKSEKNIKEKGTPILRSSVRNKKDFLKNGFDIKKMNIDSFGIFIGFLWVCLIGFLFYSYKVDIYDKIKNLPTQKSNIEILKQNIEKQQQELDVLNSLTIDDKNLEEKEKLLSKNIFNENSYTAMNQIYALYSIAKDNGINIESLQKNSDKVDENKIVQYGDFLSSLGISNFYEKAWYNNYIITTTSDEETILSFKKSIDDSIPFMFKSFTISENQQELQYSITIKAFYKKDNF